MGKRIMVECHAYTKDGYLANNPFINGGDGEAKTSQSVIRGGNHYHNDLNGHSDHTDLPDGSDCSPGGDGVRRFRKHSQAYRKMRKTVSGTL